jgi:hypothetical protein
MSTWELARRGICAVTTVVMILLLAFHAPAVWYFLRNWGDTSIMPTWVWWLFWLDCVYGALVPKKRMKAS